MRDKLKRIGVIIAALAALALGGSAFATATQNNGAGNEAAQEHADATEQEGVEANDQAEGPEANDQAEGIEGQDEGDASELASAADAAKARAAAENATGGKAGDVSREATDGTSGPADDDNEASAPAGSAFEVEVDKGSKEIKVHLGPDFAVLGSHVDQGE